MALRKLFWFIFLIGSVWLLTACGRGSLDSSTKSLELEPPSNQVGSSLPIQSKPSESVALAYDPGDGSLDMANRDGLSRWQVGSGWEKINFPNELSLSGVIINPDQPATIFVSGPGLGVLRSDDGGVTWKEDNEGLPSLEVTALALHSSRRDTLYIWVRDEGIFRTEDGGASWKRVPDQGPPDVDVRGLTHSTLPGSMNTGWLYAATPTGAYLSMDCF